LLGFWRQPNFPAALGFDSVFLLSRRIGDASAAAFSASNA
jgi:hypothetical protein